ncbi:inositol polyphosphate 5-phosphatase, partial [Nowakowskiella sp. JEL0078]
MEQERESILFVRDSLYGPEARSIVLKPPDSLCNMALVIDVAKLPNANGKGGSSSARFQPSDTLPLDTYSLLCKKPVLGCLGLVQVENDLFVGIVTESELVAVIGGATVYRIRRVAFYSVFSSIYDSDVTANSVDPTLSLDDRDPQNQQTQIFNPCQPLIKLLQQGTFYYSHSSDLSRSLQQIAVSGSSTNIFESAEPEFVWNKHILSSLMHLREQELDINERDSLDRSGLLILAIQGFIGLKNLGGGNSLAIISRLSCKKAGTRFLARGVDDDGNVSNFVETELRFYKMNHSAFSFVMVRGSIPLFWEQRGIQVTHRIDISRGHETTAPAVRKHFENLLNRYSAVQVVSLLSLKDESAEKPLADAFQRHVLELRDLRDVVKWMAWDFHANVKVGGYQMVNQDLILQLRKSMDSFSYFCMQDGDPVLLQEGVMRVNCLDCLDRTNFVETAIGRTVLENYLRGIGNASLISSETYSTAILEIWADNGDWLSRIYAGTGALKTSVARKGKVGVLGNITGLIDDAMKSANRFYTSNFLDKSKQQAIDLLLGKLSNRGEILLRNPLFDAVSRVMEDRSQEFTTLERITVWTGTWNVNGKYPNESIGSWLFSSKGSNPVLYVVGIQEMIELTPGQVISIDTEKLRAQWEAILRKEINHHPSGARYVSLKSTHTVALGIFFFVREDWVAEVKDVDYNIKRTGLGGMAGNKGGIGISVRIFDTTLVFIVAHFAAGASNVDDRNRDYMTISRGLRFRSKIIEDHDMIFWIGDFNYRISLPNDELNLSRQKEQAFEEYREGGIGFLPTYKYNNGTNVYDTSEKGRTPSWTDRILFKGRH